LITWKGDDVFSVTDTEYVCRPIAGRFRSQPDRFCLLKARWQVEWYDALLHDLRPRTMIEVGMFDGASMALAAELTAPDKIVGIDFRSEPSAPLEAFIASHRLDASVRPFYGVDQRDVPRIDAIVAAEFGDAELDLVIDDASHLLDATRTTFNALFPRLRTGGKYVIEDWPTHMGTDNDDPLTLFVIELVLACSDAPGVVGDVVVNRNYVTVERGRAPLTPGTFDLSARPGPRGRALLDRLS
jgi:hypothetical protein